MNKIILNLPHSSKKLPKKFLRQDFQLSKKEINSFNQTMTDLYTSSLFSSKKFSSVVAPYSRIFCDIEKFTDDEKEIMSKYGLGAIYTKTDKGIELFSPSEEYKTDVIKNYYYPLHKKLDRKVKTEIEKGKNVILIDCHSFSKETVEIFGNADNLPDVCIGTNVDLYCNDIVREIVLTYFKSLGYEVKLNYPYCGAMIPDYYIAHQTDKLNCIMIEINRKIYLNKNKKNNNFNKIKKDIYYLLKHLKKIKLKKKGGGKTLYNFLLIFIRFYLVYGKSEK